MELQNRTLGPANLLAYLSPHGWSPLQRCAFPTLATIKRGGIVAPGDQTQKRVCISGDVAARILSKDQKVHIERAGPFGAVLRTSVICPSSP